MLNFSIFSKAPLTNDDKILINILHLGKDYSAVQMMREFPEKLEQKYALRTS